MSWNVPSLFTWRLPAGHLRFACSPAPHRLCGKLWQMGRKNVSWVSGLTLLGLLVMLWAASAPVPRFDGDLPLPQAPAEKGPEAEEVEILDLGAEQEAEHPLAELRESVEPIDFSFLNGLLQLAGLAAAAAVLYWLLLRLRRWWAGRTTDGSSPVDAAAEDLDAAAEATGSQARRRALASGSPRNAVVACWAALEDAAAAAGLDHDPAETSAEFTQRVLSRWNVDAPTIAELAELYRIARFSRTEPDEQDRRRAVDALDRVHRAIEAHRTALSGGPP